MKAKIVSIGKDAISEEEDILIFFDQTATEGIAQYAIIQEFVDEDFQELAIGDTIKFGEQSYTIEALGEKVTQQLKDLGHVSFFFGRHPEGELINAITLKEDKLPKLDEGVVVTYKDDSSSN